MSAVDKSKEPISHVQAPQKTFKRRLRNCLPVSERVRTKPAFESPWQKMDHRGKKEPIKHTDLGFSLDEILHETDIKGKTGVEETFYDRDYNLPGSYKSFAKWEMHFSKDHDMQQLIQK